MKVNYHTHTCFCDGSSNPEEYVLAAIEKGFSHLGFSGHAPVPFENIFAIQEKDLATYCNTIRYLQEKYKNQINIHLGLELDYIPSITASFEQFKEQCNLDYMIGAVHLVKIPDNDYLWFIDGSKIEQYDRGLQLLFDGNIQKAVRAFFDQTNEMIATQKFDIIGHFDKIKMNNKNRYFSENDTWYKKYVLETLDLIKQKGLICEINTRGIYKKRYQGYYPSYNLWEDMRKMNIPVMVNSDAHDPSEMDFLIEDALMLLKQAGYKETWYFNSGWKSIAI